MTFQIPGAVSKIAMEKAVKFTSPPDTHTDELQQGSDIPSNQHVQYGSINNTPYNDEPQNDTYCEDRPSRTPKHERLNMMYMLFWTYLATFLGVVFMFWVDFIPGFGMQSDIKQFLPQ